MLQGILIVVIVLLLLVVVVIMVAATYIVRLVRKVKNFINGESDYDATDPHSDNFTGRRQQQYSNQNWERANGKKRGSRGRIIDQRDPQTANRKIIDDNVGEYVEFEETK